MYVCKASLSCLRVSVVCLLEAFSEALGAFCTQWEWAACESRGSGLPGQTTPLRPPGQDDGPRSHGPPVLLYVCLFYYYNNDNNNSYYSTTTITTIWWPAKPWTTHTSVCQRCLSIILSILLLLVLLLLLLLPLEKGPWRCFAAAAWMVSVYWGKLTCGFKRICRLSKTFVWLWNFGRLWLKVNS